MSTTPIDVSDINLSFGGSNITMGNITPPKVKPIKYDPEPTGEGKKEHAQTATKWDYSRTEAQTNALKHADDPEKALADMYQQQLRDFNEYQKPVFDQMLSDAESDHITRMADMQADGLGERTAARQDRMLSMDGSHLLPSQRKAMGKATHDKVTASKGGIRRAADLAEKDFQMATRANIMHMAENLQTTGVAGIAGVAAAKASRDEKAKEAKGGMMGQIGSIAGGVIGGIYGGPAGAALGSSVGGMAGKSIGGG